MTTEINQSVPKRKEDWDDSHPLISSNFFSNGVTAIALVVGLFGLALQGYLSNDTNQRQAVEQEAQTFIARQLLYDEMWTGYMELAIAFPRFAEGPKSEKGIMVTYSELSPLEQVQYQWFFDRLAYTAESILALEPANKEWLGVFEDEFAKHSSLLVENPNIMPEWFCYYDKTVRPFMLKAVSGQKVQVKDCSMSDSKVSD